MNGEVRHLRTVKLGHQSQLALEMAGNGNVAVFRTLHTNGAASIGNVDRFLLHSIA